MTSSVVRKYARSLAEVALEKKSSDRVNSDLRLFKEVYDSQEELRTVLNSPALPLEVKRRILIEILNKTKADISVRNFLLILLDRNRLRQIDDLIEAYQVVLDENAGLVRIEVSSPRNLDPQVLDRLKTIMGKITGKKVQLAFGIDKSLIGGIKVQVGSRIYDGTIKTRLEELGRRLAIPS